MRVRAGVRLLQNGLNPLQLSQDLRLGDGEVYVRWEKKDIFSVGDYRRPSVFSGRSRWRESIRTAILLLDHNKKSCDFFENEKSLRHLKLGVETKIETDFLPKFDFPHKVLTKNILFFSISHTHPRLESSSLRS